jgi:hypothetical protein
MVNELATGARAAPGDHLLPHRHGGVVKIWLKLRTCSEEFVLEFID